jgi:hypothetical protein
MGRLDAKAVKKQIPKLVKEGRFDHAHTIVGDVGEVWGEPVARIVFPYAADGVLWFYPEDLDELQAVIDEARSELATLAKAS